VSPQEPEPEPEPEPIAIDAIKVIEIGISLWVVALGVIMLVPALHLGHWWPWACASGIVGGGLALWYVRRGRGNAATALRSRTP